MTDLVQVSDSIGLRWFIKVVPTFGVKKWKPEVESLTGLFPFQAEERERAGPLKPPESDLQQYMQ